MKKIAMILAAVLAVLFLGRGAIANAGVRMGVKAVTGLRLEMRRLDAGLFRSQIHVTGMKLHNPAGFRERITADVPELYVDVDLPALLRGETHGGEDAQAVRLPRRQAPPEGGEGGLQGLLAGRAAGRPGVPRGHR